MEKNLFLIINTLLSPVDLTNSLTGDGSDIHHYLINQTMISFLLSFPSLSLFLSLFPSFFFLTSVESEVRLNYWDNTWSRFCVYFIVDIVPAKSSGHIWVKVSKVPASLVPPWGQCEPSPPATARISMPSEHHQPLYSVDTGPGIPKSFQN